MVFAENTGFLNGAVNGLPLSAHQQILLETLLKEALKSSEIEGKYLNRKDVYSSIRKNLGLYEAATIKDLRAKGVAKLAVEIQKKYQTPLTEKMLLQWHEMVFPNSAKLKVGGWRSHHSPM